jgi:hypothetical protein
MLSNLFHPDLQDFPSHALIGELCKSRSDSDRRAKAENTYNVATGKATHSQAVFGMCPNNPTHIFPLTYSVFAKQRVHLRYFMYGIFTLRIKTQ